MKFMTLEDGQLGALIDDSVIDIPAAAEALSEPCPARTLQVLVEAGLVPGPPPGAVRLARADMSTAPRAGRFAVPAWLRWLLVIPAVYVAWHLAIVAGMLLLALAESFCPAEQVVSGMCIAPWFERAETVIFLFSAGLAAVLFIGVAYMMGVETPAFRSEPPVVGWIDPGSPAAEVDLQVGDLIVAVDGNPVTAWHELETSILTSADHEVTLEVVRGGTRHQVAMVPESITRYGFGYSGIQPPVDAILVQVPVGTPARSAGQKPAHTAGSGNPVRRRETFPRCNRGQ